ncbi:MAG: hypothetical protein ACI81P_001779 [Neolewinella sp.]|jgi:hypothetical protein
MSYWFGIGRINRVLYMVFTLLFFTLTCTCARAHLLV